MGNEFDSNGFYIGWSPLFRYDSIEALNASETFTTPNGKRTVFFPGGLDITPYLNRINKTSWNVGDPTTIAAVGELLQFLDDNSTDALIKVSYDESTLDKENAKFVINELVNNHNLYKIKGREAVSAYKNSVSSRITQIIQNLKNMNGAYSPIEMAAPQEAARESTSGREASTITMQNPGSKFTMQVQNMDGKSVIGIAAVGEKIFFANSYYFNEGIRSGDPTWTRNMRFDTVFNQVQRVQEVDKDGNVSYKPVITNRGILANTNFNELPSEYLKWSKLLRNNLDTRQRFKNTPEEEKIRIISEQLGLSEDQSLIISALLSSATDNAKELILSKINAGTNLAGMYLHLIMLGFNFRDIAAFMTSPTVQLVNDLMKSNMFNEYSNINKVDDAIKMLEEGPSLYSYVNKAYMDEVREGRRNWSGKYNFFDYENVNGNGTLVQFSDKQALNYVEDAGVNFNRFVEEYNYIQHKKNKGGFDQKIFDEFKSIYTSAKETTKLGQMYSINQGLRTNTVGKLRFINNAESAIQDREELYPEIAFVLIDKPYYTYEEVNKIWNKAQSLGITKGNFNFKKFLNNETYRNATIDYYDTIKAQWNIFDMIMRVPHFKALYEVLKVDDTMNTSSSNKFKIITKVRNAIVRLDPVTGRALSESQLKGLEDYVDNLMIMKWLDMNNYSFTIDKGDKYFDQSGIMNTADSSEKFTLSTPEGRATFKLWIEQKIIPELKDGFIEGKKLSSLSTNSFVQDLQMNRRKEKTGYQVEYAKLPLDLMDIKTETDEAMLEKYKEGFQRLNKIKLQDKSVADHFFLYNLIVNKNRYGSDKLTPLFNSLLESGIESSLILDYQKSIGTSDYLASDEDITFSIEDALIAVAPLIKESQKFSKKDRYVRIQNPSTKKYDLFIGSDSRKQVPVINKETGKKEWITKIFKEYSYAETVDKNPELLRVYNNYFVLNSNDYSNTLAGLIINPGNPRNEIEEKLKRLVERNTLNIVVNCE